MDKILASVQELAETQHSLVSVQQMYGCGATKTWIWRRAADGFFIRDGPDV